VSAAFICLPSFLSSSVISHAMPARRSAVANAERRGLELPGEDGDPDLEVRLSLRPHPELFHDDRDAIDPERRADGRQRAPREHADQVVVATAATERSDLRLGDAHLPHAARVVVESAGERVVDGDPILLHAEVAREIRDPRNVLEGHGIDVTGVEHFPQARDVGHAHRLELGAHALAPDLVELVERREELRLRRRLHRVREAAQDRAVVHDDLEVLEPERHERVVEHGKAFRVGDRARAADRVDVALPELAEASLLRAVGAPHGWIWCRLNGIASSGASRHARERNGQVVAQREVGLAGRFPLAALQDLEDELCRPPRRTSRAASRFAPSRASRAARIRT
jgi:hypothetical protein